jgi:hypothetical protein
MRIINKPTNKPLHKRKPAINKTCHDKYIEIFQIILETTCDCLGRCHIKVSQNERKRFDTAARCITVYIARCITGESGENIGKLIGYSHASNTYYPENLTYETMMTDYKFKNSVLSIFFKIIRKIEKNKIITRDEAKEFYREIEEIRKLGY